MILRYLLRTCDGLEGDGGNNTPAAPSTPPVTVTPNNPAKPRAPTSDELATEFVADAEFLPADDTKPVEKKETPAAPKDEKKVDLVPEKKEVKPIVPASVKKEEKKPEPQKIEAGKKPEIKPILPPSVTPKGRDYSGFSDEEQKVLKAMSNEAFEYTSKALKENKELAKLKDAQFVQHPQAYLLDPNYSKLNEDISYYNKEASYWQEQLANIKAGKEWAPITAWNKDGTPVLGAAKVPDSTDEERVRMAMNQCYTLAQNAGSQLQQFVGGYQQRVAQDNQVIQQECAKYFGWVADPKMMDAEVEMEGVGNRKIKDIYSDFLQMYPPYYRNTLPATVSAHLFVAMNIYGAELRAAREGKQIAEVKAEEVTRAEPTSEVKPQKAEAINGVTEFNLDGLPM